MYAYNNIFGPTFAKSSPRTRQSLSMDVVANDYSSWLTQQNIIVDLANLSAGLKTYQNHINE